MNIQAITGNISNFLVQNIGPNNTGFSEEIKSKRNWTALAFSVAAVAFAVLASSQGMWVGFVVAGAAFISPRVGAACFTATASATGLYALFKGVAMAQFPLITLGAAGVVFPVSLIAMSRQFSNLSETIQKYSLEGIALNYISRPGSPLPV